MDWNHNNVKFGTFFYFFLCICLIIIFKHLIFKNQILLKHIISSIYIYICTCLITTTIILIITTIKLTIVLIIITTTAIIIIIIIFIIIIIIIYKVFYDICFLFSVNYHHSCNGNTLLAGRETPKTCTHDVALSRTASRHNGNHCSIFSD